MIELCSCQVSTWRAILAQTIVSSRWTIILLAGAILNNNKNTKLSNGVTAGIMKHVPIKKSVLKAAILIKICKYGAVDTDRTTQYSTVASPYYTLVQVQYNVQLYNCTCKNRENPNLENLGTRTRTRKPNRKQCTLQFFQGCRKVVCTAVHCYTTELYSLHSEPSTPLQGKVGYLECVGGVN